MRTIEIPRDNWSKTLDEFSSVHEGWLISLAVRDATFGLRPNIRNLPLLGITVEPTSSGADITIAAARSPQDHITHTIKSPTHVRLEQTLDGADVGIEIESTDGTVMILRFRTTALPETVDGMVRR